MNDTACYGPNVVLQRHDSMNVAGSILRPGYSLARFGMTTERPRCASVDELLRAVERGAYDASGRFVTECRVPEYSTVPDVLCVRVYGDSFTRHMLQAVSMITRNDLLNGGFARKNVACVCDGQFSEHPVCRRHVAYPFPCASHWYDSVVVCDGACRGRPRVLWVQGGLHYGYDAHKFARVMSQYVAQTKPGDRLFTAGGQFQSAEADRKYPNQRASSMLAFNRKVRNMTQQHGGAFVDFAPVTDPHYAKTSDGVHFLTAVNYFKARVFLALLHLVASGATVP